MKKVDITFNETVKEAIALALIKLLDIKLITQISISEIVKMAGVSRSSFYRNFDSKEQVLSDYIQKCYKDYFKNEKFYKQHEKQFDFQRFLYMRFKFIKQYRDCFIVLKKNHLLSYIFDDLDPELASVLSGMDIQDSPYSKAMFSSCSAGIIRQWINNDFKESEEEMVDILIMLSNVLKK